MVKLAYFTYLVHVDMWSSLAVTNHTVSFSYPPSTRPHLFLPLPSAQGFSHQTSNNNKYNQYSNERA